MDSDLASGSIVYSIGTPNVYTDRFHRAELLIFDAVRGYLVVPDSNTHCVNLFSTDDGSFIRQFGFHGNHVGVAIDEEHGRLLVVCRDIHRLEQWSLCEASLLMSVGRPASGDFEFNRPHGVAIDRCHGRVIVVDTYNHRLVLLSLADLSLLFTIGTGKEGRQPREFSYPIGVAVDHDRERIIVTEQGNSRVQVLSSIDGAFLFEFGSKGEQAGQFSAVYGVCVDHYGRIIVADTGNSRLQAFTSDGRYISSFGCLGGFPFGVAIDDWRGLIAFSACTQVHVIGANRWLPGTFRWGIERIQYAPESIKQVVVITTMIRSLVDGSPLSSLPNELLFEIFSFL